MAMRKPMPASRAQGAFDLGRGSRDLLIDEVEGFSTDEAEVAIEMMLELNELNHITQQAALKASVEAKLTNLIEALSPLDIGSVIYFTKVFKENGPVYHYAIVHTTQGWAFTGRRTAYYDIGMLISILIGYGITAEKIEFLRTERKPIEVPAIEPPDPDLEALLTQEDDPKRSDHRLSMMIKDDRAQCPPEFMVPGARPGWGLGVPLPEATDDPDDSDEGVDAAEIMHFDPVDHPSYLVDGD